MKKIVLVLFMSIQIVGFSQEEDKSTEQENNLSLKKNEIKVNLGMFVMGLPEVSYERILSDEQSVGISAAVSILGGEFNQINYMITSRYRFYFGKQRAAGFFMEGNLSLFEETVSNYYWNYSSYYQEQRATKYTQFGAGIAAGAKAITKNNWTGEIYAGAGRNLLYRTNNYSREFYPRIGFSFGKRF